MIGITQRFEERQMGPHNFLFIINNIYFCLSILLEDVSGGRFLALKDFYFILSLQFINYY